MLFIFDTKGSFASSLSNSHTYKCPFCSKSFNKVNMLYLHVESFHSKEIPDGVSAKKYIYDLRHPGEHLCQICKINKCVWNEKTGRYSAICDDPTCRQEMRRRFLENYKKKNGKDHSIDDPEIQREMLRHKKSSGYYSFQDGGKVFYASSYEKDFLEFCDQSLNFPSDFIEECNFSFEYIYEGKKHFYLPDYYIRCYDLIIEIKADDDVTHPKILAVDKETEKLKDKAVIEDGTHNFIKICDKKYEQFINLLNVLKNAHIDGKGNEKDKYIIIPERANTVRGFQMPKLNFISSESDLYNNKITNVLMNENRDKNKKGNILLLLMRDYIPTNYKNDDLFKCGDIVNNWFKCKEYQVNIADNNELKRCMNEFKNYYTKQCEHLINQNYMSPRLKLVSRTTKFLDFSYIDEKKKKVFFELTSKYLTELELNYVIVKKNLGYGIFIFSNQMDKKEKDIQKFIIALLKRDFYTIKMKQDNIISDMAVIPGTVDGGTNVTFIEDYSNFELEE